MLHTRKMDTLSPYLSFNGNCREAMIFYQWCFGGELTITTLKESSADFDFPGMVADLIFEAVLELPGFRLTGSDMIDSVYANPAGKIMLQYTSHDRAHFLDVLDRLSLEATITHPMDRDHRHTTLLDQFGIHWMLRLVGS